MLQQQLVDGRVLISHATDMSLFAFAQLCTFTTMVAGKLLGWLNLAFSSRDLSCVVEHCMIGDVPVLLF